VTIESNCPVNFEYEIEILKNHPDINIGKFLKCFNMRLGPNRGDIFGLQTTEI
jgi:hypothetical protein